MVALYRYGQTPFVDQPLDHISLKTADVWWQDGCGLYFGRGNGRYFMLGTVETMTRDDGSQRFDLTGPVSERIILRSSVGVDLLWRYLARKPEAMASVHAHEFGVCPVQAGDRVMEARA